MKILIAGERELDREALKRLLGQDPELSVVAEVAEADNLLPTTLNTRPELVLLDWEMAGLEATSALRELRQLDRPIRVVVFGPRADARSEALAAGADAFVSRQEPAQALLNTVRLVGQLSPCFV